MIKYNKNIPSILFSSVLLRNRRTLCNNLFRGRPRSHVISSGSPGLCQVVTPRPRIINTPFTHRKTNISSCFVQCIAHVFVIILGFTHSVCIATVFVVSLLFVVSEKGDILVLCAHTSRDILILLHPIHSPFSKYICILFPVVLGTRSSAHTCVCTRTSIKSEI